MRIALGQLAGARLADWPNTQAALATHIEDAADCRADLLLLPECAFPCYLYPDAEAYRAAVADGMPDAAAVRDWLCGQARRHRLHICCGLIESDGTAFHNAAVFIDARGEILGEHRKLLLWADDHRLYRSGETLAAFDTDLGRIGIMICADARLPEIPATLVADGAELILQPTAWVTIGDEAARWNPQPEFLIPSRAAEFGVPIASCSKVNREADTTFVGQSLVCDHTGTTVAAAGRRGPELLVTTIDPRRGKAGVTTAEATRLREAFRGSFATEGPVRVALGGASGDLSIAWGAGQPQIAGAAPILATGDLARFAPARLAAAEGAPLLVATGPSPDWRHARARAAENRVHVLIVRDDGATWIDPTGTIAGDHAAGEPATTWEIDTASAADKQVAPQTDIFANRTPELYRFG